MSEFIYRILVLDDQPERHAAFDKIYAGHLIDHVYTVDEALKAMQRQRYDVAQLDHDLGDDQPVGSVLTRQMREFEQENRPKRVIIHSHNPVGANNMLNDLRDGSYRAYILPFKAV